LTDLSAANNFMTKILCHDDREFHIIHHFYDREWENKTGKQKFEEISLLDTFLLALIITTFFFANISIVFIQ